MGWCRATRPDVAAAVAAGLRFAHVTIPVSDLHLRHKLGHDRAWARRQVRDCVLAALDRAHRVARVLERALERAQELAIVVDDEDRAGRLHDASPFA